MQACGRPGQSGALAADLLAAGATVTAYDPVAMHEAQRVLGDDARIGYAKTPNEALAGADALVIEGSEAYAEDGWKRIRIGDVEFRVVKPCSRCILTTIDPQTGERSADREPLATLQKYRAQADGAMFGQNLVNDGNGRLEVGMPVEILE